MECNFCSNKAKGYDDNGNLVCSAHEEQLKFKAKQEEDKKKREKKAEENKKRADLVKAKIILMRQETQV